MVDQERIAQFPEDALRNETRLLVPLELVWSFKLLDDITYSGELART